MAKTPQLVFDELTAGLPIFDDGRINFTDAKKAPVINVIVYFNNKILIVKRSDKVSNYNGLWNGISGFIDQPKPIEEFAILELTEELSIEENVIDEILVCTPYQVEDKTIDRIWYVYPVLAKLNAEPIIKLDWEHTDYKWINRGDLKNYQYVKDFDTSVDKALELVNAKA